MSIPVILPEAVTEAVCAEIREETIMQVGKNNRAVLFILLIVVLFTKVQSDLEEI